MTAGRLVEGEVSIVLGKEMGSQHGDTEFGSSTLTWYSSLINLTSSGMPVQGYNLTPLLILILNLGLRMALIISRPSGFHPKWVIFPASISAILRNPPQSATLHVHQPPIIHVVFALEAPGPGECDEAALRDEVGLVCRRPNDWVVAQAEDDCPGGDEVIAHAKFLPRGST